MDRYRNSIDEVVQFLSHHHYPLSRVMVVNLCEEGEVQYDQKKLEDATVRYPPFNLKRAILIDYSH